MGRNFQHSDSMISVQNNGQGCMWGVLHILKYQDWSYFKKKIPYRKLGSGRNYFDVSSRHGFKAPRSDSLSYQTSTENSSSSTVDEKMPEPIPVPRNSVKSWLKSLISDELNRMKGRHHRNPSATMRTPLMRTESIHRLDPLEEYFPADDESSLAHWNSNDRSPTISQNDNVSNRGLKNPFIQNSFKVKESVECSAVLAASDSKTGATREQFVADHALSPNANCENQDLVHAMELNVDASTFQSKEMLDALGIINMNKDIFLKVLQDPGSPLAHHFHRQQTLSSRRSYSLSFSSCNSFPMEGSGSRKLEPIKEIFEDNAVEPKAKEYIRSKSLPTVPAEYQTTHHRRNRAVMKRFKNLKYKIKHVIRHNKKEKHRISMDGVLDKIPQGQELAKVLKSENFSVIREDICSPSPRSSCVSRCSTFSSSKTGSRCMSRTPSLTESLDRYCQFYEISFKGDFRHRYFESFKIVSEDSPQKRKAWKPMRRLFSSPELESYLGDNEDTPESFPPSQVSNAVNITLSTISDSSEQSDEESPLKCEIQQNAELDTISEDEDQQGMKTDSNIKEDGKLDSISEEMEAVHCNEDAKQLAENNVPMPSTTFEEENACAVSSSSAEEEDLKLTISIPLSDEINDSEDQPEEMIKEIPIVAENGIEKIEITNKHIEFQIGAKDKAEFDYVKDILELSGFSKNEELGTWHSDNQPMDPSLYNKKEGCTVLDPESRSGTEEDYPGYHLLLFDLINEILMEVYARSYSYYPMRMSTCLHIRPMPVGYHVLEEVWSSISWYLSSNCEADQLIDYIICRDLGKCDGWMNLQFDCECVALEVEDIIFDDLLDEIILIELMEVAS